MDKQRQFSFDDPCADPVLEVLGHRAVVGGEDGALHRGCLKQGVVVAFLSRGTDVDINAVVESPHSLQIEVLVHVTAEDQLHPGKFSKRRNQLFEALGFVHPIAGPTHPDAP